MSASSAYPVSAEPLERLHALLVEAVRRRRGSDPHASPVTVAEIYQELVPYRSVRAALGLELNADYEHTLVRLLSGEGRLARIEPAAARDQLERELASPNPNVAIYRKFAGCDVWLQPSASPAPGWVMDHLAEAEPGPSSPEPTGSAAEPAGADADVADEELLDSPTADAASIRQPEPPLEMTTEQEKTAIPAAVNPRAVIAAMAGHCAFCDSVLPVGRQVRFCPFCGADQTQRPCAVCGEPLHQEWAYCIACGEPAVAADA